MASYLAEKSRDLSFSLILNRPERNLLSLRESILELPTSIAVTFKDKLLERFSIYSLSLHCAVIHVQNLTLESCFHSHLLKVSLCSS